MDKTTEILHKELDLIQAIISRMANNGFLVKGWFISLLCLVLALNKDALITEKWPLTLWLFALPLIVFWWLDAFFLHKEKCYRALYNWVVENRTKGNMEFLYDLDYTRFKDQVKSNFQLMLSSTLSIFYGLSYLILLGITLFSYWKI